MFKAMFMAWKGEAKGHPFRGNQWGDGRAGDAEAFALKHNKRTTSKEHLLNVAFNNDKELLKEFNAALEAVDADVKAGKETFRAHVTNLEALLSGKAKRPAYTKERLKEHNRIINKILEGADKFKPADGEAPEVIFLGGRGGSGKGGFDKKKGFDSGVYDANSHLLLDPDKVKHLMKEYEPEKAYLTHRESAYIFDKVVWQARQRGLNVVLDTTMNYPLLGLVSQFHKGGYKSQAHFMQLSPEGAVVRAASRWANDHETLADGTKSKRGRLVPPDVILGMVNNEKNFDAVAKKVKTWSLWANDRPYGEGPRLIPKTPAKVKKMVGWSQVFKANPYHGPDGRFASHAGATFVSIWGKNSANIDAGNNKGKNALAAQHHMDKVKSLAHALGVHVRGGGSTGDAFGKAAVNQAKLHAQGVDAYATHALNPDNVTPSYRGAVATGVGQAFAKSGLSTKEKIAAKIPLTKDEEEAIEKSKEYDKKHYSKKMKASKLAELPALFEESSNTSTKFGADSAEHKKAKAKLDKVVLMAQKHGASDDEVAALAMEAHNKTSKVKDEAKVAATNDYIMALNHSNVSGDAGHVDKVHEKLMKKYAGVLSDDALYSALVGATKTYNEQSQSARDKLSDAFSAYQPFKHNKAKGVTWDTLAATTGVSKEQMKKAYDDYQAAYKHVTENYGEIAATKAVAKGKELHAAKKVTGVTPISEPVQLSAKSPKKPLSDVLTGAPKVDNSPSKSSDHPSVASGKMKKPATKEDAMDAAKALGMQYYLLKQEKYPGQSASGAPKELSDAHSLYQQAKDHYVSLGGKMDEFSSISSALKNEANQKVSMAKVEKQAKENFHKDSVKNSAQELELAKETHKVGSKALKTAIEKHGAVVKSASEHLSPGVIETYEAVGTDKHKEAKVMVKASATTSVQSAAAALHTALLAHPKDKEHEDVLKAASHLDGVLKINSKVLSSAEVTAAKSAGRQLAAANHNVFKAFKDAYKNAPKVAASYDKSASTFKEVTNDKDFKQHGYKEVGKLTSGEKKVISSYTGAGFTQLNRAVGAFGTAKMKGDPTERLSDHTKNSMKQMDSVFSKTKLGANVNLRRNMPQKYFWDQLGIGLEKASKMSDSELAALAGKVYKETAYSSTSTRTDFTGIFSKEAEKTGALSLKIRAGKDMPGLHAKSISIHSSEEEVVLPRGTTYVIRSVKRNPGSKFLFDIQADMIGAFPDQL